MRFGEILVEVPPFAFLQPTATGQAALVDAVAKAIGEAGAVADLFAGVGTLQLSVPAGRKVDCDDGAADAIVVLTCAARRAQSVVANEHREARKVVTEGECGEERGRDQGAA